MSDVVAVISAVGIAAIALVYVIAPCVAYVFGINF